MVTFPDAFFLATFFFGIFDSLYKAAMTLFIILVIGLPIPWPRAYFPVHHFLLDSGLKQVTGVHKVRETGNDKYPNDYTYHLFPSNHNAKSG